MKSEIDTFFFSLYRSGSRPQGIYAKMFTICHNNNDSDITSRTIVGNKIYPCGDLLSLRVSGIDNDGRK